MTRCILHVDLNNFYASVECLYRPQLAKSPVAVSGDIDARHGIILAKNQMAKRCGVTTGEAIWQAKLKCPELILLPPDFKKYLRFSRLARQIYNDYTDQIEPFGIDEAWLDVTGSLNLFGSGVTIADEIRRRIRSELGLTVSVGVSFNKIFAKLGSDLKKPDATTIISREKFRSIVWPLPAGELLYVGRSTQRKLASRGIYTIGDLAKRDLRSLILLLGQWGETLWHFANGCDESLVKKTGETTVIKSIGNSTTAPRDIKSVNDAKIILYVLAESVASRLRVHGLQCHTVALSLRDKDLISFERQTHLTEATATARDISRQAIALFRENWHDNKPLRSLGVRGCNLVTATEHLQLDLFDEQKTCTSSLESTIDEIRRRFGTNSIQRCIMLTDRQLSGFNPKDDHVIHPVSFFR